MFSQTYQNDCPIRVRTRISSEGPHRGSYKRLMPLSLNKPWFMGTSALALSAGANGSTNYHNAMKGESGSSARWSARFNANNVGDTAGTQKVIKEDIKPMPYHNYNPVIVHQVQSDQVLPIHYWFYVYLYSSDVDKLLTPFVKMVDSFGADRRLTVIMNRCGVQILLKELELYKSLPRRIVVIKGAQWTNIVQALVEMEDRLPDLMRFATFPMLLDTDTTKYACTKFDRTACISRITKPIY